MQKICLLFVCLDENCIKFYRIISFFILGIAFLFLFWYNSLAERIWRNWQTRMIQVHVGRPVQVQVLLSAPNIKQTAYLCGLFFIVYLSKSSRLPPRSVYAVSNCLLSLISIFDISLSIACCVTISSTPYEIMSF